jgi:hypothetical protein
MELAGRALALLGGVAFFVAIVLINGGYIYKTTCPTPTGGSESSWSYNIDDVIPYSRSAPAPCSTHSVSRLALSWTGIWSLGHTATPVKITAADKQAAVVLGAATKATSTEFAREKSASAAITKEMKAKGVTQAVEAKLVSLIKGSITKWEPSKPESISQLRRPTSSCLKRGSCSQRTSATKRRATNCSSPARPARP